MKEYTVNKNDSGQRVDKFISKAVPRLPKSLLYKYVRLKRIKLNGKRCEISHMLKEGDVMQLYINDEFFDTPVKTEVNIRGNGDRLEVVYEDHNIIIVYKPRGIDVHHGAERTDDTLVDMIQAYLYSKGEYHPDEENTFSPSICNRLDRNTSGLVIAAKNACALREINESIRLRQIKKEYMCVLVGKLPKKHSTEQAYHRKGGHNKVEILSKPEKDAKRIVTEYTVEKEKEGLILAHISLITGRTHQIRAHMAYLGAPVLGDGKYGNVRKNKQYKVFHQQLCAYRLTFDFNNDSVLSYLNEKSFQAPRTDFVVEI